jgi:hypothetical protein
MSHARQQLRAAIATLLAPTAGGTYIIVRQTRIDSTRPADWDYLKVFADGDASERMTIGETSPYDRVLSLAVIGMLKMPGNRDTFTIEDKMEAMAAEIEGKMTNALLRAQVPRLQYLSLVSTSMDVLVDAADKIDHAELTQSWLVGYSVMEGAPETLI